MGNPHCPGCNRVMSAALDGDELIDGCIICLMAEVKRLREPALSLANNLRGMLGAYECALRTVMGHTNHTVLEECLSQVFIALGRNPVTGDEAEGD